MNFVRPILIAIAIFSSTSINAGTPGSGYGNVAEIAAGGPGTGAAPQNLIYFIVDGTMSPGSCADATTPHFVVSKEQGGETMISMLLAAKMAGKKIHVVGRGECSLIPGHEDVSYIYMD